MADEEDSWDAIDWDQKISEEHKPEKTAATATISFIDDTDEGNYFESNEAKKKVEKAKKSQHSKHAGKSSSPKYIIPYSHKELRAISSECQFQNLIFKVFGEFEKFMVTHEAQLSDESLIELVKINVMILQVPFANHNRLLISRLLQVESFWEQILAIIKEFYEKNCKDPKYLLMNDMKGFFENIESLINWLVLHGYLRDLKGVEVISKLTSIIKSGSEDESLKKRLNELLRFMELSEDMDSFEILPKLSDIQSLPQNLEKNIIKGKYHDVFDYLKIQLPLLKEDFMCKLRSGFEHLNENEKEITRTEWTHDAVITPNVKIEIIWQKHWNINCPFIIANFLANFNSHSHEIFNGQLVCFTTKKMSNDLIVATVLRNSQLELLIPKNSVIIEIVSIENVKNIFDHRFIMIEPRPFFDPYAQVFNALKCLHEHNFPFKNRILKLQSEPQAPSYDREEFFSYKNFSFKPESDWENFDFGLEEMQLKALKSSLTNNFTQIVGPPGCGKSFIGVEIVKILLENTNEKILVLTQTNNALDKFLAGCLAFTEKIVRFGAQSKAKELANFIAKRVSSHESKIYQKKLHATQRDIVASLIDEKAQAEDIFKEISFHYRLVEEINQLDTFHSVADKRIFGMTTSFAAHNSTLTKMLVPGIVVIEEASEILESHVIASITKDTKQIIMIGDHHQLRPQTNSTHLQKLSFDISLYERLIMNKFPHITLDVQMRMRPMFCDLVRDTIYDHLKDGDNVKNYPDVKGMSKNLFFLTHNQPESSSETSKENLHEVDVILKLYKKLLGAGNNSDDITILTPYAAQAKRFKEKLNSLKYPQVRVAVLDAYQGEESNIILLSLVRSNKTNDIGFLTKNNRISVVLSRAKIGFYICGNIDCFAGATRVWNNVREILIQHDAIGSEIPSDMIATRTRLTSKN